MIKHRQPRKLVTDGRPILKDSASISIAKELQGLLDKHRKSKSQVFKGSKPKKLEKSKQHNKSKKVMISQQTSKQREFQSK